MSKLVILVGPSGVGKGTIESILFKNKNLKLKLSISATTRAKRPTEQDGINYYFLDKQDFENRIKNDEFLEWNAHFDNYYGTLKSQIKDIQNQGFLPLLEIDTNGAIKIIEKFKKEGKEKDLLTIFILPPSLQVLKERIKNRLTETDEEIAKRLQKAKEEILQKHFFQYHVVNEDLNSCVAKIEKILLDNRKESK
ncbi:guanylate kinase [Mesomycoplasma conjunctivae]|uniref:guanylate kinase n=1 Tax=Mesomycoplasma conjunctivae TaxID=45361 RepID=UPI003DA5C063